MSVVSAKKIFVDPGEEVTFIIQQILNAEEDRIILVIPQDSMVFSSIVSLKTLYHMANKARKVVIFVTEDKFGISAAQKIGYVTVSKVSQISTDLWDVALTKHLKYLNRYEHKRKGIDLPEEGEVESNRTEEEIEIIEDSDQFDQKDGRIDTQEEIQEVAEEGEMEDEDNIEETVDVAEEMALKPSKDLNIVTKGNIQIVSGGDVRKLNDKIFKGKNTMDRTQIIEQNKKKVFSGKDLTREIPKRKGGLLGMFKGKIRTPEEKLQEVSLNASAKVVKRNWKKYAIIGGVSVFILLIILFLIVSSFAKVNVSLTLEKSDVDISETVNADLNSITADFSALTIPAELVEVEGLNASRSADATGTGETGTKATGVVTIYNKTSSEITLPAGTKIKSVANGLEYELTSAVTIPAATESDEGVITPAIADDKPVQAVAFGDEYNITGGGSNTLFEVAGFPGTAQLEVKRFRTFEGGTKETFTTASAQDVENLKKILLPEIEKDAKEELESQVRPGYRLIEESIKFEETKAVVFPKEGEEVTDGTFTLTLEGKITGFAVLEEDLEAMIEYIASNAEGEELSDRQLSEIGELTISGVTRADDTITFTLSTSGTLSESLTEESIEEAIKGKGIGSADDYLGTLEGVEDHSITYSPGFIPGFLRKVPNANGRINVVIK